MAARFQARFTVHEQDLQRLMNCIVEHARPDEARDVERVLGALASVAAGSDRQTDDELVVFSPPRGTAPLVQRALDAMARSDRHEARSRRSMPSH